ncbi:MAG TPA: hypothetical protein DDY39_20035, partial [Nitrospira sp.]|nr:hypothetical protein [Nitrospira sp.]
LYQAVAGDWRYILTSRDNVGKVTAADVRRVAAQYFTRSNRTVAVLVKKSLGKSVTAMSGSEVQP